MRQTRPSPPQPPIWTRSLDSSGTSSSGRWASTRCGRISLCTHSCSAPGPPHAGDLGHAGCGHPLHGPRSGLGVWVQAGGAQEGQPFWTVGFHERHVFLNSKGPEEWPSHIDPSDSDHPKAQPVDSFVSPQTASFNWARAAIHGVRQQCF